MRDRIKDKTYFNKSISRKYELINKTNDKLKRGEVKAERIKIANNLLISYYRNLLLAKYSRGDDMFSSEVYEELKTVIELIFKNWEKNLGKYKLIDKNKTPSVLNQYTFSFYLSQLELISLAVLLEIKEEDFALLVDYIDRDNIKDFLIDFLLCSRVKNRKPIDNENYIEVFHINENYGRLKSIIKERDKKVAQKELKYFLGNEWYSSFKGTPLFDQHKNLHDTYVGYWCIISAAIVKIMELDDKSFRDNQYYPKELIKE